MRPEIWQVCHIHGVLAKRGSGDTKSLYHAQPSPRYVLQCIVQIATIVVVIMMLMHLGFGEYPLQETDSVR